MMGFFPKPPWRRLMNKATQCLTKIMFCKKNDILMTTPFLFRFSIVVSVYKGIQIENFPFSIMLIHHQFVFVLKLLNVLKERRRKISYFRVFSRTLAQPVGWRRCWKSAIFRVGNLRAPHREPNNWEPIKRFAIRKYDEQDEDDIAWRQNAISKLNEMWNIV